MTTEDHRGTRVNVQLLGCIELRTAGGDRIPASPAVGLLLAALAWSPNAFVADDELVDRLWEDGSPAHPRNALYTLATRLRKALDPAGTGGAACAVVRRRGGYLLSIDEEAIDVRRFRTRVRRARDAACRGTDEEALRLYEGALAQWRGDPLSGLRTAWADAVRVALGHEWRSALLNGVEVALRLNRHDDYLPQLQRLAALHPLDERVSGLLMLALHRSGRQNEALQCFHRLRFELVRGLGDEPGPELRALHERILRRDERLVTGRPLLDALAWS
ncbi:AfsR/SARP family transcriptional regulator [Streptomyces collinus]